MKTLETERLILRMFEESDQQAVHEYASCYENLLFMPFGPNDEQATRDFIGRSIKSATEEPCTDRQYAVVLKSTGRLIGGCSIGNAQSDGEYALGWILHRDYWRKGYGTELGEALMRYGFEELGAHRIIAYCDAENAASYGVMEKLGMRREAHYVERRKLHRECDRQKYGRDHVDEYSYAMLKSEWETKKEIAYYNAMPYEFEGFIDVPELRDADIYLVCTDKKPEIPEKKFVPGYDFHICRDGQSIGHINLRIGYTDGLYYGGQIGYGVDEAYRGNGYAVTACKLLLPVMRAHKMEKILITNNHDNTASRRVCEKLGARLVRVARLPEWHDIYKRGTRYENIFEWSIV